MSGRRCAARFRVLIALILGLIPCICPAQDLPGLDDDATVVGAAGDPAGLIIRGAAQIPADEVRAAIAESVDLLPLRQEGAQLSVWRDRLAEKLRVGYRHAGFRAATVHTAMEAGHVAIDIVEGERTRYGAVRITGPDDLRPLIADLLSATSPALVGTGATVIPPDIATRPASADRLWQSGSPVDDRSDTLADLSRGLEGALRRCGRGGAGIAMEVVPAGPGQADLSVTVKRVPAPLRVGAVVITGLPDDQAERLRAWLAIPPAATADATMAAEVRARLRDCGRFAHYQVGWEDDPAPEQPEAPVNGVAMDITAAPPELSATTARVAASGRCDLLITVKPCPDAPMPWTPSPAWDAVRAARAAMLARLNSGRSDLVVDMTMGGRRYRFTWSPRRGFVIQVHPPAGEVRQSASLMVTSAGFYGDCGEGPWTLPGIGMTLVLGIAMNPSDDRRYSVNANINYQSKAEFSIASTLEPAACSSAVLLAAADETITTTWDGPVLVARHATATSALAVFRVDPDRGIAATWTSTDGSGSIEVVDHDWDRTVLAITGSGSAAVASATTAHPAPADPHPATVGDLLTFSECLGAPPLHPSLHALVAPIPIGDYMILFHRLAEVDQSLTLDDSNPQMSHVVTAVVLLGDEWLASRLPAHAWPRRLLNAVALGSGGDVHAAAASLRPLFDDPDAGPSAFLSCAAIARLIHVDSLTVAFAEAGLARCNADGLAADARACAGLSDPALTAMGVGAGILAGKQSDPAKAADLHAFARACAGPDRSGARLEVLARHAVDLGFADWMKDALKECEDSAASFW
jgi:hypothetical protein